MSRRLKEHTDLNCKNQTLTLESVLLSEMVDQMGHIANEKREECRAMRICLATQHIIDKFYFTEGVSLDLLKMGKMPFISMINCQKMFQNCVNFM